MKKRLVIHGGFAKCGSSAIQTALINNIDQLRDNGIFMFDEHLKLRSEKNNFELPIWTLQAANESRQCLTDRLVDELNLREEATTGLISSENLDDPAAASIFEGLDKKVDVEIILYVRPQIDWIPSAWKQWGMKDGHSLTDFVIGCMKLGLPSYQKTINSWLQTLPSANIQVRFLIPDMLFNRDPARDFFHTAGLGGDHYSFTNSTRNTSFDYSILHIIYKNPHIFRSIHDLHLQNKLEKMIPLKYQSTNIAMLSTDLQRRIEIHFREENLYLLSKFGGSFDANVVYNSYFQPKEVSQSYIEMNEMDIIYRFLGILLSSV